MYTSSEIRKIVKWKDLTQLSQLEKFIENFITLPWLAASLVLAHYEYYLMALPFSFFFFLTALRQAHNGFHRALGTNKAWTWLTLFSNSILMIASMHAVKFNHLRHHKYCLGEDDYEGKCARLKWYQAILYGPIHIHSLHYMTLKHGNNSYRLNMVIEVLCLSALIFCAVYFNIAILIYHVIVMVVAELFSAFFAVWSVHHDSDNQPYQSRTQRSKWKNFITFNMFYHMEHHLFPAVPTIKLPMLAKRIDEALPKLELKQTF